MASIFEEIMGAYRKEANEAEHTKVLESAQRFSINQIKLEGCKDCTTRKGLTEDDSEEEVVDVEEEIADGDAGYIMVEVPGVAEDAEITDEDIMGKELYKCSECGQVYIKNDDVLTGEAGDILECPKCSSDNPQELMGVVESAENAPEDEEPSEEPMMDVPEDEEPVEEPTEEEIPEGEEPVAEEAPAEELPESVQLSEADNFYDKGEREKLLKELIDTYKKQEEEGALSHEVAELLIKMAEEKIAKCENCKEEYYFDDSAFANKMEAIIAENYNTTDAKFKVESMSNKDDQLKLKYSITAGNKRTSGTMIAEGYKPSEKSFILKIRDKGAFTEAYATVPSFIVECVTVNNCTRPVNIKYNYKVKVNESVYRVSGESN